MVPKELGSELTTVRLRSADLGVDRGAVRGELDVEGPPSAEVCSVAALRSDGGAEHSVLWCTVWLLSAVTLMWSQCCAVHHVVSPSRAADAVFSVASCASVTLMRSTAWRPPGR